MGSRQTTPPDDDFERWITDLARGETTAPERPTAEGDPGDDDICPTCSCTSAHPDYLPTLRSA